MSNTEFNATNGENTAQNALNTQSASGALDSEQNSASNDSSAEPKHLKLSEFLQSSEGRGLPTNDKGQFVPDNKQIKILVNCVDDSTGALISLDKIDTSKVTKIKNLFENSTRLDFSGIEKWNVGNVDSFAHTFHGAEHFNADISEWNVSKGKTFQGMFEKAVNFDKAIGAKWDTQNATNMIAMFRFATNFNNGGQAFGEKWKMDKVEYTWEMFWGAEKFNAEGLNKWIMSKVIKCYDMFMNAKVFNQPLYEWNLSNAVNLARMFNKAESFNQNLSAWGERLGKAKSMDRMFADTKALNQTFTWKLNENCNTTNITKGSPLKLDITFVSDDGTTQEKETLQDVSQSDENATIQQSRKQNKKFARNVGEFRIYKVDNIPNNLNKLGETRKMDCLYRWIPKNIKENYAIFLAKNESGEVVSATDADWEFIYYNVFGDCFAIETDKFELPKHSNDFKILTIEQRKDDEEFDEVNFDECKKDYENDDIEIILEDKEHIMRIYNGDTTEANSYRILNIIGALILAKAYEAKMEHFNDKAREKHTKLTTCHKEICEFDLHFYQNTPVEQNLALLEFWEKISKRYRVANKHNELKETIAQVAKLVSEQNQAKMSRFISIVAILVSLFVGIFAPPIREWIFEFFK